VITSVDWWLLVGSRRELLEVVVSVKIVVVGDSLNGITTARELMLKTRPRIHYEDDSLMAGAEYPKQQTTSHG